jgi:mannose-6-phosphate isomerase
MISIKTENKIKKVIKPWGHELWLADKENKDRFAFKKIFIKAPYQSSFQFHEVKEETIYIASGHGILHYSNNKIDIEKFKLDQYSQDEIDNIVNTLDKKELKAGDCITVKTGYVHSVEATQDLTIMEASTLELDDVYRLNDKYNRSHGHVASEHNQ